MKPDAPENGPAPAESIHGHLADDHRRLDQALEEVLSLAGDRDADGLRGPWDGFELDLLTHLHAEEVHLLRTFRRYESQEARELAEEHAQLRALMTEVAIDLDLHQVNVALFERFGVRLRAHASRENGWLYPWAARHLSPVANIALRQQLARHSLIR
jgi:Hemerythrin HHE cation binding domain